MPVRVDVGFGDAVTPGAQNIEYPSLLDMPAPRLRAYPPETVVAERFQAVVALGLSNSRMKDFFDLWAIGQTFPFDGALLARASRATFERRVTPLPDETPLALTAAFAEDASKQAQRRGFLRRTDHHRPRILSRSPRGRRRVRDAAGGSPGDRCRV